MLDQRHGELLMWHAVSRAAHVFRLSAGYVKMYTQKNVFLKQHVPRKYVSRYYRILDDTPLEIEESLVISHQLL